MRSAQRDPVFKDLKPAPGTETDYGRLGQAHRAGQTIRTPKVTLKTGDHPRTFTNRNRLVVNYPFVNGVKTGHTRQAGYVLVGSASRNGIQLISAVLDTPSENARRNA